MRKLNDSKVSSRASWIFIAILSLICSQCSLVLAQTAEREQVLRALRLLQELPQWKHLDEAIVNQMENQARTGPLIHPTIRVVTPDDKPVPDALIVIVESTFELVNHVYLDYDDHLDYLKLPLDLSVSDANGQSKRSDVRTSRHSNPRHEGGKPHASVMAIAIHPDWGWSGTFLKPTDEPQMATIQMMPSKKVRGRVSTQGPLALSNPSLTFASWSRHPSDSMDVGNLSLWYSPFIPRASIEADGHFVWHGMPDTGWISLQWLDERLDLTMENNVRSRSCLISDEPLQILLEPRAEPVSYRFVDSETQAPISSIEVHTWKSVAVSGNDGIVTVRRYPEYRPDPKTNVRSTNFKIRGAGSGYCDMYYFGRVPDAGEVLEIPIKKGVHIQGQVIDKNTGLGIHGIHLVVAPTAKPAADSKEQMRPKITTYTDHEGRFSLYAPKEEVTVTIDSLAFGYEVPISIPPPSRFSEPSTIQAIPSLSQTIDLNSDVRPMVTFELAPRKPLHGIVKDGDGNPVRNAQVRLAAVATTEPFVTFGTTNAQGEFDLLVAPSSSFSATLAIESNEGKFYYKVPFNQLGSFGLERQEFQTKNSMETRTLHGRVTIDNEPVEGAKIAAYSMDNPLKPRNRGVISTGPSNQIGIATTDDQGNYVIEIDNPEATHATLRIHSPTYLANSVSMISTIQLNKLENRAPDLAFRSKYGDLTLSGEIVSPDGQPVVGATVYAYPEQRDAQLIRRERINNQTDPSQDTSAISNAKGEFVCKNLGPGLVQLQVYPGNAKDRFVSELTIVEKVTSDTHDHVFTVDPKLAAPAEQIEVRDLGLYAGRAREERDPSKAVPVTWKGRVVDTKDKPIAGVIVFVFAVRPLEGPATINPLMHPLVGISATTQADGTYQLVFPDDSLAIRLAIGKAGYTTKLSKYSTPDTGSELSAVLKEDYTKSGYQIQTQDKQLVPNVLVISENRLFPHESLDLVEPSKDLQFYMSDEQGFLYQSPDDNGRRFGFANILLKPGYAPTYVSNMGPSLTLGQGWCLEGRIVDEQRNPVAGYPIECFDESARIGHCVATGPDGVFRLDGIHLQSRKDAAFFLSGQFSLDQPDERGWLATRLINVPQESKRYSVGDLVLSPSRSLAIELISPKGGPGGKVEMTCAMRGYRGHVKKSVAMNEILVFPYMPSEPILISIGKKIKDMEPWAQRIGSRGASQFGLPMDEDIDLKLIVAP